MSTTITIWVNQSMPVNWHSTTEREFGFFELCSEITGYLGTPKLSLDLSREAGSGQ